MDDIVLQAMVKWPNVPDCFGWLGLSARGNWYMRDDRTQSLGAFASGVPGAKGSMLQHAKLIEFIQRNYAADGEGRWYFQNGPQRVYVELEATPWVWRIQSDGCIHCHDGQQASYLECIVDEQGWVYLNTTRGFGLVHTQDMENAAAAIERGDWTVAEMQRDALASHFRYVTSPQQHLARK